jgi:aldehyde dehydrogenase (NAD+)
MQGIDHVRLESPAEAVSGILGRMQSRSRALRTEGYRDRIVRLDKLRKWILDNREKIQRAVFADFRRPAMEVETGELFPVLAEINHAIDRLAEWVKPRKIDAPLTFLGTRSVIAYEPKGVCLIISPWNYPFNLCIGPLVSCLAAGNNAVLKPSELTPHTSALIAQMADEIFEQDVVSVVLGDAIVSEELLRLPFDHIFFTGSPAVGKIVMKAAAENLTSVTLELGGKSPAIIDETANLRDAARRIAFGKFFNNGQTCIAPDYILIAKPVKEKFISLLGENINKLFGRGMAVNESSPDYARIVNGRHFRRLSGLLQEAVEKGAKPVFGGTVNEATLFFQPTILTDLPADARIMEEEIFGPVLPVLEMDSQGHAIEVINSKPKPLALYLFSNNSAFRKKVLRETSAGGVCINDCVIQFAHLDLPFGGVNNSGMGKSHGYAGFLAFSNEKPVITQKSGLSNAYVFHPPFGKVKRKMLDLLIRWII